jgi:hypothetical protein
LQALATSAVKYYSTTLYTLLPIWLAKQIGPKKLLRSYFLDCFRASTKLRWGSDTTL